MSRDQELDELLSSIQCEEKNDLMEQRWRQAVEAELVKLKQQRRKNRLRISVQLVAAVVVGFIIGTASSGNWFNLDEQENKRPDFATVEHVFANY